MRCSLCQATGALFPLLAMLPLQTRRVFAKRAVSVQQGMGFGTSSTLRFFRYTVATRGFKDFSGDEVTVGESTSRLSLTSQLPKSQNESDSSVFTLEDAAVSHPLSSASNCTHFSSVQSIFAEIRHCQKR